jgi:Family of unknown function (DUF5340)
MEPIPLPSHIHYELLLQLLERQTLRSVDRNHVLREQVQELIVNLRKAASQQRQIEESCQRANLAIDYRWSLNQANEAISTPLPKE